VNTNERHNYILGMRGTSRGLVGAVL
jgi:hypothetical protein